MSLAPGARLGPYEVLAPLGAGGMSEVYRAKDLKLGRVVAIKILRNELAREPDRLKRFEQEARSASALNHPNIVTIYDIGKEGDTPYIAMECVDGASLRETLRGTPLPSRKLLQIGAQIAEALARAHTAGIVHRDLKPANIMLTDYGLVKILDFGLAKLLPVGDEALEERSTAELTQSGIVMGTVGYMSPEQARGQRVDHRSDQFALGLILYEMATGHRLFRRETAAQTLAAIMDDEPEPLLKLNPHLPPQLPLFVARCLAKSPGDRYESTRDLARDLRDLLESTSIPVAANMPRVRERAASITALAVATLAAGSAAWWFARAPAGEGPAGDEEPRRIVAVLPFKNLSPDPTQSHFAASVTEEIRGRLSKLSALRVLSRSAVDPYGEGDVKRLGLELGAGSVVEGSVWLDRDRARIAVALVDAQRQHTLWSEQYERKLDDLFRIQSDVALRIAEALSATLSADERARVEKQPTENLEAYHTYLRSQELSAEDPRQNLRGIELLRRAVEMDPGFAVAYADLAYRTYFHAYFGDPKYVDASIEIAQKALKIDPDLADAHYALATAYSMKGWASRSRLAFHKALELDPSSVGAMENLSILETVASGRHDEALYWARRAFQLSRRVGKDFYHLTWPLLCLREDATAERWLKEGERRFPESARVQLLLAVLEYLRGQTSEALARARRLVDADPGNEEASMALAELAFLAGAADTAARVEPYFHRAGDLNTGWLFKPESFRTVYAHLLAEQGETSRASELFQEALQRAHWALDAGNELAQVPIEIAAIHAARGEKQAALDWLERGYKAGHKDFETLGRDPIFRSLRADARFQELRERMRKDLGAMRDESAELRELRKEPFPPEASSR